MSDDVRQFYDDLAGSYQFIFPDWKQSVLRQADVLAKLLTQVEIPAPATVLDCTCGIGTQAIGLATKGYHVHGTDLSPDAVARAEENARQFETPHTPTFAAADLLSPPTNPQHYDVVLSCDNSVAHFHTDEQLAQAVQTMLAHLKEGGLLFISLRDYDSIVQFPPHTTPVSHSNTPNGEKFVFQVWDWADDLSSYKMRMYFVEQKPDAEPETTVFHSHLRALLREDLEQVLLDAGLRDVQWYMPEQSHYYQPIVTAWK